jgi:hypothetical protein
MVYNGCKYVGTCLCKSCDDPCCDHCDTCIGHDNPVEQCDRGYSYGDGPVVDPLDPETLRQQLEEEEEVRRFAGLGDECPEMVEKE